MTETNLAQLNFQATDLGPAPSTAPANSPIFSSASTPGQLYSDAGMTSSPPTSGDTLSSTKPALDFSAVDFNQVSTKYGLPQGSIAPIPGQPGQIQITPLSFSSGEGGLIGAVGTPTTVSVENMDAFLSGTDPNVKKASEGIVSELRKGYQVDFTGVPKNKVPEYQKSLARLRDTLTTVDITDPGSIALYAGSVDQVRSNISAEVTKQQNAKNLGVAPGSTKIMEDMMARVSPAYAGQMETEYRELQSYKKGYDAAVADGDFVTANDFAAKIDRVSAETMSQYRADSAVYTKTGMFQKTNLTGEDTRWDTEGVMLGMTVFGSIYGIYASQKSAEDQMEFQKEMGDLTWERQKELLAIQQGYSLERIGAQGEAEKTGRSAPTGYKSSGTQGKVKVK